MTSKVEKADSEKQDENEAVIDVNHDKFRWFAVLSQPNMEKRARESLKIRIEKFGLTDCFGHIVIPTQLVDKIDAKGEKRKVEKKLIPGYMLIQIDPHNVKAHSHVTGTPKISTFVGMTANKVPLPVSNEEVDKILNRKNYAAEKETKAPQTIFEKGQKVRVVDGPFSNFVGDIDEVKPEKMKLRLLISVFGRATPVEIEFSKVEKVKDEEQ
jgi:transcriptional antiterminator NusG